ncbi:uncharacterized protein LOC125224224 [Salvia hispanica]|uniref:uncharacterized protein LOC125224224 n=1 Tax=Salvia hispanica TaxID=49212 RepID=UPI002008FC3A|nr:uncharacterized protein LOC125224224 [Salvia hispanica]
MASDNLDNSMLDMLNVINKLLAKQSPLVSYAEKLVGALNDGEVNQMTNVILKWLDFAPFFKNPHADDVQLKALEELDEEWAKRFSSSDKARLPHLLKWFDYIQNQEDVAPILGMIVVEKADFEAPLFCASSKDHTVVEPLIAPDGAKVGECVTFSGLDGKQLDKIAPLCYLRCTSTRNTNLFTDVKGVAMFDGIPFMTSSGSCSSSIPNGSIK